jgi:hypothetical protein
MAATAASRRHPQRRRTGRTSHGAGSVLPHPPEAPPPHPVSILADECPPEAPGRPARCCCRRARPASRTARSAAGANTGSLPARRGRWRRRCCLPSSSPSPCRPSARTSGSRQRGDAWVRGCAVAGDLAEHDVVPPGSGSMPSAAHWAPGRPPVPVARPPRTPAAGPYESQKSRPSACGPQRAPHG